LHQLRHSRLTHLAEGGVQLPILMAKGRHTSLTSLAVYAQPNFDAVAAATAATRPRPPPLTPSRSGRHHHGASRASHGLFRSRWPASPSDCGCGSVADTPPGPAGSDGAALGRVGFTSGIGAPLVVSEVVTRHGPPGLWQVSAQASINRSDTHAATARRSFTMIDAPPIDVSTATVGALGGSVCNASVQNTSKAVEIL
jgi:hypothetical protein